MEATKKQRSPQKNWTYGELELLRKWQHHPIKEIARRLNRSARSVEGARRRFHCSPLKPRGRGNPVTPIERVMVYKLRAEGLPQKAIAAQLGRGQWTISNILRQTA
jgi:DNA-binding CsgD family transcriptional regulator